MKKYLLTLLLAGVLWFGVAAPAVRSMAQAAAVPAHFVDELTRTRDVRSETFDIVWRTIKEKHFDATFGGVDWDKVRERYAPRAAAARSDSEFHGVLREMLGELRQSHFNVIPPEEVVDDDSPEPKEGAIGIDLRLIDRRAVITRADQGSRAASAGLRTGFIITRVADTSIERFFSLYEKSSESRTLKDLRITRAVLGRINGPPDTTVRISYLDERDQPRQVTVTREKLKGEMSRRVGNFPPQYMEFETRRLANQIGYLRFNVFVVPLMDRIRAAIRGMSDAPGIIIDLRGNPGGFGGMAPGIAGVLESKQTSLGTMRMRTGYTHFAVFPQPNAYLGPVVILADGSSASTSEIFAGGMQEIGRAIVVGERTAGAALPSVFQKLPTGAIFQYAIADFKTPKGTLIEGRGVQPDFEVKLTRRSLLEGRDAQLEAAIEQIKKQSSERKAAAGRPTF